MRLYLSGSRDLRCDCSVKPMRNRVSELHDLENDLMISETRSYKEANDTSHLNFFPWCKINSKLILKSLHYKWKINKALESN